jgi:hypothetical protein
MEGESWERDSSAFARSANEALDALQGDIQAASEGSYRSLWERTRFLGDSIRTAPAISSTDKIELQRRLNVMVRELRERQRAFHRQVEATRDELNGRLELARDTAAEAQSVSDIQEVRADLALLRDRITGLPSSFPRSLRTQLWESWQEINRTSWDVLVTLWTRNEEILSEILDRADENVKQRQTRAARDDIKAFHDSLAHLDVSRHGARGLRRRANDLWKLASELGREQRARHLAAARQRLTRSRRTVRENEQKCMELRNQVQALEHHASNVSTGMGHALALGQLAEARRALEKLEAENRRLQKHIAELGATVEESATQST